MAPWGQVTRGERLESRERNPKWKNPPLLIDMSICINCDTCIRHCPPQFGAIFNHGIDVDHHPRAVLGLRQVPRPVPGRLHLPRPRLDARRPTTGGRSPPPTTPTREPEPTTAPGDPRGRALQRRRRAPRRARAPRLHRQPELDEGRRPGARRRRASPSSARACRATAPTSRTCSTTTWADWSGAAEAALDRCGRGCRDGGRIVVAGLSMGGALTAWLGTRHPELAGIAVINAVVEPPGDLRELVDGAVAEGTEVFPGIGSDIADPDVAPRSPTRARRCGPLLTLLDAIDALQAGLGAITCPVLSSRRPQDHVVPPSNSDHLAASVSGPVERVTLERSYHVATLDYDKALIERARSWTSPPRSRPEATPRLPLRAPPRRRSSPPWPSRRCSSPAVTTTTPPTSTRDVDDDRHAATPAARPRRATTSPSTATSARAPASRSPRASRSPSS